LSEKYHARQVEVHPDKFSGATEKNKLRAVQLTSYLNEAYSTLKSPIKRAAYLLTINGLQFLFISFLRFSVVIQKDALVSLAKFLYFWE